MSKKNNVNPNRYKTAGRDRPGDNLLQHQHRLAATQAQAEQRREATGKKQAPRNEKDATLNVVPDDDTAELEK